VSGLIAQATPALTLAAQTGDRVIWFCGQLVVNAIESIVAATELLRTGRRLQPGVLLRTAIEAVAMAAHLRREPDDLGRFLSGAISSSSIVGQAKAILPIIPVFWGHLSKEYAHLGELYQSIQWSVGYESSDDVGANTNLLAIHMSLIIVWIVAEFVFFDSLPARRFWTRSGPGEYVLEIPPEMNEQMDQLANRFGLKDPT
jgi:hypothetical protein